MTDESDVTTRDQCSKLPVGRARASTGPAIVVISLRGAGPGRVPDTVPHPLRRRRRRHATMMRVLDGLLAGYQAAGESEARDLERMLDLAAASRDPWSRALPLHFTASALVVHRASRRVLLRWHAKHQQWLQVGGHGDPGESDPLAIARREAREETGLTDLVPWPDAGLLHAVVCHVPASATEPEHEHADLRYVLATERPDAIAPESEQAPLRWLSLDEARALVGHGNNIRDTLDRLASMSF